MDGEQLHWREKRTRPSVYLESGFGAKLVAACLMVSGVRSGWEANKKGGMRRHAPPGGFRHREPPSRHMVAQDTLGAGEIHSATIVSLF